MHQPIAGGSDGSLGSRHFVDVRPGPQGDDFGGDAELDHSVADVAVGVRDWQGTALAVGVGEPNRGTLLNMVRQEGG